MADRACRRASRLLVALAALAMLGAGCAEPSASNRNPPPPEPSAVKEPDPAQIAALNQQWRAHKAERRGDAAVRVFSEEAVEAGLALADDPQDRADLAALYAARMNAPVFLLDGELTEAGRRAMALTAEAWTHGVPRPAGWPGVKRLESDWRVHEAELRSALGAELDPHDVMALFKDREPPALEVERLGSASLGQLERLDRLEQERVEHLARLDAGLVVSLWKLHAALGHTEPAPPAWKPRQRKRRWQIEWEKQQAAQTPPPPDPLRAAPEHNLHLFAPNHPDYEALRQSYARYRALTQRGALVVPEGDLPDRLNPGQEHPMVPTLRARLVAEGFLQAEDAGAGQVFDAATSTALRAFQRTRGLDMTGLLDKATLKAMAVPGAELLARLELGLRRWHSSRAREVVEYLRVNLMRYEVQLVDQGEIISRVDAVVGTPWNQTPRFEGLVKYLEVHPWWWGLRSDPKRVPPGPNNPLGALVFRVEPRHLLIYLHGTNQPELLKEPYRAFSHGCVRMAQPWDLGGVVLDRDPGPDNSAVLKELLAGRRWTRRLNLDRPLPVFFEYNTTFVDEQTGHTHFMPDLYRDDARVAAALAPQQEILASWFSNATPPGDQGPSPANAPAP